MATTSKANTSAKTYQARVAPAEGCTGIVAQPVSEVEAQSRATTEAIVRELMAKGVSKEKMRIPGKVKSHIVYMADDFDAPLDDFKEHL